MSTQTADSSPAPLPVWLSIPIILVCLVGGGWIIHWYVMTDPISHESRILGDAPAQAAAPQPAPRNRPAARGRSIQQGGSGFWIATTEKARLVVAVENGKGSVRNIFYLSATFLPDQAHKTLLAARSLYQDQKRTEAMKLTVQQVGRIRSLSNNLQMALSTADKQALATAMTGYVSDAPNRPALEGKVLQLLDEVSDQSMEATKQEAIDHANKINQIITPQMWQLNQQMGGGGK
jgi:hypothetical protein